MKKLILILSILFIQFSNAQVQLIIDYESETDFIQIMESKNQDNIKVFPYPYIKIPEMNDAWLVLLQPEQVTDLETALKLPPLRMNIIGTYNKDGTQYIWTETGEIQRNHSINKYKNQLKDIVIYDQQGNELNRRRPTEIEALNTQVNKIYGWNDRIITEN